MQGKRAQKGQMWQRYTMKWNAKEKYKETKLISKYAYLASLKIYILWNVSNAA